MISETGLPSIAPASNTYQIHLNFIREKLSSEQKLVIPSWMDSAAYTNMIAKVHELVNMSDGADSHSIQHLETIGNPLGALGEATIRDFVISIEEGLLGEASKSLDLRGNIGLIHLTSIGNSFSTIRYALDIYEAMIPDMRRLGISFLQELDGAQKNSLRKKFVDITDTNLYSSNLRLVR